MGSTHCRRSESTRVAALLVLVGAVLTTGCYSYRGVDRTNLGAGTEVRAHLSPEATQEVRRISGREMVQLEGRIENADDDTIILRTRIGAGQDSPAQRAFGQRLVLPMSQVQFLEIKELDRRRTALLVSAAAAAIVTSVVLAFNGTAGGNRRRPSPSPELSIGR